MATEVVPRKGRRQTVACPGLARRLVRRTFSALLVLLLAAIALGLPPLSPPPAAAAPSDVTLTLTQSSASSAIGTEVTLTATLSSPGNPLPDLPSGWFITFSGTRSGGWSSGPIRVVNGVATYRIASPVATTDTITASVANPECAATDKSDSVAHEWWVPLIGLGEGSADGSTLDDQTFTLSGTVSRSDSPVPGASVDITVTGLNGADGSRRFTGTTNTDGRFSIEWVHLDSSLEEVEITATGPNGFRAERVTSHVWTSGEDYYLTLLTTPDEPRLGDDLGAGPLLYVDGEEVSEPSLYGPFYYWDDGAWQDSGADDQYTYPSATSEGWQVLGVQAGDIGVVGGLAARWSQPVITFLSPGGTSPNGEAYPASVVVTDGRGNPVGEMNLAFAVRGEGEPYAYTTTNSQGIAVAPITRQTSQTLTIEVSETTESTIPPTPQFRFATAETTHTWLRLPDDDPNPRLSISTDAGGESRVGTQVSFTAHLTDDNEDPLPNWNVDFYLDGEDFLESVATDVNGDASIQVTHTSEMSVSIMATAVVSCGLEALPAWSNHYWWETWLGLAPEEAESPARQNVTFTAEVARTVPESEPSYGGTDGAAAAAIPSDMIPLGGQLVRFTMTSERCELPVIVKEAVTSSEDNETYGIATVSLTRDAPGFDTVRAEEVGVPLPAADETTHEWTPPSPAPRSIELTQSEPVSRAGTSVSVTATVYDTDGPNGRAAAGTPVTFLGISPSRTVETNSQGVARLTFTGKGTATSVISATAPYGCGVVEAPEIRHGWFVPDLVLSPAAATSTTGNQASVTARLTNAGEPVDEVEIELTINHSVSGQPTESKTKTTDADGEATFTWTRTVAGSDKLTATEQVDVQPQQDTAEHIWEAPPVIPPPVVPPPVVPPPVVPPPVVPPPFVPEPPIEPPDPEVPSPEKPTEEKDEPTDKPDTELPEDLPATSTMVDGPEVGRPGGDIQLSGTGCRPGEQVTVNLGDRELGKTRAAGDGSFYIRAAVPDLPLGRYVIHSSCGTTIGDPNVDITAPQVDKAGGALATAGLTTGSILVFFVLIAKGVISFLPRRPY